LIRLEQVVLIRCRLLPVKRKEADHSSLARCSWGRRMFGWV